MNLTRRSLLTGLGATALAAPAIVRCGSIMPVKALPEDWVWPLRRGVFLADPRYDDRLTIAVMEMTPNGMKYVDPLVGWRPVNSDRANIISAMEDQFDDLRRAVTHDFGAA